MNKFLMVASVAMLTLFGCGYVKAEDATPAVKAPSAAAICGYKWREAKKADTTLKGRDAWNAFRVASCGGKSKTRNDDAIKQYLDAHKDDKAQSSGGDDKDEYEERAIVELAKFKKK